MPIWPDQLTRVHLTREQPGGGKVRGYIHLHGLGFQPSDVTLVGLFMVTSLARTVFDLSCQLDLGRAVAIGDAALRMGLTRDDLDDQISTSPLRHGIGKARRTAALLDERSESPQESRSRVLFHQHGIPRPEIQYVVLGRNEKFVARCDFGWPELKTVGEFDGRVKYGRVLRPDQDLEEVLFDEKVREDLVRDLDLQMVRWISRDLEQPAELFARLNRAFRRGGRLT